MTTNNGHASPATRTMTDTPPARRTPRPPEKKSGGGAVWFWLILFLIVLGVVAALVLWRDKSNQSKLNSTTQDMAEPTVLVVHPQKGDPHITITLPGTVNSLIESSVYSQVSGYVKRWYVDIGGQVRSGQLLADIDTPVTDQQLLQAQESVKQAEANLNLAKITANRYNDLFGSHAVSQQDLDNQNANVKVQEANLSAAQAFVGGIQKTEAFKQVRAPFDGVITARRIDIGDYVTATGQTSTTPSGNGPAQTGTPNQELFSVAQTRTLRVYVNVPEYYASETVPGITANLELASDPNTTVTGKLVRTADAIDPSSLTLLTEIDVDNSSGKLLPGGYAQVHFDIVTKHPPLVIPGNSLIFRAAGPQVGVVDDSGVVELRDIKIGRDLGTKLEVVDGINEDDAVIVNPSDSLADKQKVRVKQLDDSSDKKP